MSPPDLEQIVALYDGEIRSTDHQLGRLFDRLKQARGPDRKVLVEHLANYAWRYYGRGSDLDVEFLGEGWNAQGRTRRLRKALQELEDDEVVVGIIRTTPRPEIGLWASVASDVRQGDLRSGASYLWLVGRMTPWPALEKFEAAVPERWEITGRNLVHGGCVWTLQRVN